MCTINTIKNKIKIYKDVDGRYNMYTKQLSLMKNINGKWYLKI